MPHHGPGQASLAPVPSIKHDQYDQDLPDSPTAVRPRTKKKKKRRRRSDGTTRNKPADEQVISSMLDALDSFTNSPRASGPAHYEVVDGYYDYPRTGSKYSQLSNVSIDIGGAPSPVVGARALPASHLSTAEAAEVLPSKRASLYSLDSLSLRDQGGLRRLVRTLSTRSRNSVVDSHSMDSDRSSRHSLNASTLQATSQPIARNDLRRIPLDLPAPRPRAAEPRPVNQNSSDRDRSTLSSDQGREGTSRSCKDRDVQPEQISRNPPSGSIDHTGLYDGANAHLGRPQPTVVEPWRKKGDQESQHASSSTRSAPLTSPLANMIPERTSSLYQTDQSTAGRASRPRSKSNSTPDSKAARRKKKAARTEKILEELGDEDETVRRIRALKRQKEERTRQEQTQDPCQGGQPYHNPYQHEATQELGNGDELTHATAVVEAMMHSPQQTDSVLERDLERDLSKAVDTTKAHKVLGLTIGSHHIPKNISSPLTLNPPPKSPGVQRPAEQHAELQSWTSAIATQSLQPQIGNAGVRRSLVDDVRPSLDMRRSHDQSPSARKPYSPRPALDKRQHSAPESSHLHHRRESVDEEVDSFMASPRLNRTVRHPTTNRIISFSEVGSPRGSPVFVCVGMGLTRFITAFYDELATTLNLRLITPERPGVSASDPYTENDAHGPMSWHQDVTAICTALGITTFSLLAHSAGAVFAMATALVLTDQVVGPLYLLAPWIPPSQFDVPNPAAEASTVSLPRSQRFLRVLPVSLLKAANGSFLGLNTSNNISPAETTPSPRSKRRGGSPAIDLSISPTDQPPPSLFPVATAQQQRTGLIRPDPDCLEKGRGEKDDDDDDEEEEDEADQFKMSATALPTDPEWAYSSTALHAAQHSHTRRKAAYDRLMVQRVWSAATSHAANPAVDLLVCLERHRDVGFRYTDVRKRIVAFAGELDRRVPPENVAWLVAAVNRARAGRNGDGNGGGGGANGDGPGESELRLVSGEGHGLMAVASVMGDALSEIAEVWRLRRAEEDRYRAPPPGVVELGTEGARPKMLIGELDGTPCR